MINLHSCYVYAITPPQFEKDEILFENLKDSLTSGIDMLQWRLKGKKDGEAFSLGRRIRQLAGKYKVPFIVNDRLDFCLILEADGLHIGQEDMPLKEARKILGSQKIIGVSTHTLSQAFEAERAGADYLGYGPCLPTTTKTDVSPCIKIEEISELQRNLKIPFFVIGGLRPENMTPFISAGAQRAAVSAGIYQSGNIRQAIRKIRQILLYSGHKGLRDSYHESSS
ncbi:MAG: thiamine phosphate synthase [bacterium]